MGAYRYVIGQAMLVLVTCIVMSGLFSSPTFAQDLGEDEVYDIILEVKRERQTLTKAVFGLDKDGKYYVPIQELARIVNFKANTSVENGTVSGFFFSEDNSFSIDTQQNIYTLRGKSSAYEPSEAFVFSQQLGIGDIYVTTDLLNKIWPLDLSLDPLKQTLDINTKRKLPYELAQARQRKRAGRLEKNQNDDTSNLTLPKIDNSYKMFSLPALDVTTTTRISGGSDGMGQNINLRGRNDLLNAQASYSLSFNKDAGEKADFSNARLLLEKQSYEEGDLPLNLELMQLGDVRPRPSRLIDGVLVGRGFLVSTESQKQIRDFDQIVVEGTAAPGWEVELYRGNELIDFQIVDDQGEYRFEDVSLNFSNTIIKTILYGPEGQIVEEEQVFNIAETMVKPGKTIVEASALDLNRDLIPVRDIGKNQPQGFANNIKIKRGLNSLLSAFATFTHMPTREDNRNYATLGTNWSFKGISGLAEVYRDLSGGTAYDLRAATNFQGFNVNLRTALFSGFESEEANFDGSARTSRTEFTLSKPFELLFGNLGLRFKLDDQRFKGVPDRTQLDFSQTFSKNALRITHGNTFNLRDRSYQSADGRINATYRLNPNWQLRSLLNYDIYPDKNLRNLFSELRYKDGNKFTAAFNVNRNFQDRGTQIGAQAAYDFEKFNLGFNTDWDKDQGFRAFLRATFSMAPYGKDGDYIFSSKNLSSRSALNGLVFLDKNYDGVFNDGDEPIEDATIDIGRRGTGLSNSEGIANYNGSPRNEYENITLNMDSLENPFTISGVDGYSGLLRPGTATYVEFPVLETGVIEGFITADTGPLAGVRMELLSDKNELIDTTSSAFDGYYMFEYMEPGSYIVRIDPTYEQLNIPPRSVSVTSEDLFQSDIDFQIFEQAGEVACADSETDDDGRITQLSCHVSTAQGGVEQPAHTNSHWQKDAPTVTNLRIEQHPSYLKMLFDYDKQPNQMQVIEAHKNKEISLILPASNWRINRTWKNPDPKILEEYMVERLPNGDMRIILKAVSSIRIKESKVLQPEGDRGYQLLIELVK